MVEVLGPTPLGRPSDSHRVRVDGVPVVVERYAEVDLVRFAVRGSATVEVQVADPIAGYSIFPQQRVGAEQVAGDVLRFDLPSAENVVVRIDGLELLFVLPDSITGEAPGSGSAGVVDALDHGADPSGERLATTALQAAIDDATGRPGGATVLLPAGVFRTGTLRLKSNVTFELAAGALLLGSADPADYPIDPGQRESAADANLPPDVRYLGRTMTFSRLLLIDRAENVRIRGRGTIDGNGTWLRTRYGAAPNLLRIRESSGVVVENVLFRNAAAWSLHVLASHDVVIRNVRIVNDRTNLNTDGIDIDMSTDVAIDRAFVHTKDDAICVKATGNGGLTGDPARIRVTNSVVSAVDAGLKIGSETASASIADVSFEDDFVFDTGRAMSVVVRDGATVERVAFRRIGIGPNVDHLVEQVLGARDPATSLGSIRDLTFDGVTAPAFAPPGSNWTWYAQFRPSRPGPASDVNVFEGADEGHALDGLRLRDVVVNGRHLGDAATAREVAGLTIGPHVRNVTFD